MSVSDNLKAVTDRIAFSCRHAGREPSSVRLVVVTKTVGIDRIREAVNAGALILGENRVQEARGKIEDLGNIASWHLIGRLQSNKAKYAVRFFDLIHSVDSIALAKELDKQAAKIDKVQDVLIEVSIAGEEAKGGVAIRDAAALVREAAKLEHLRIKGLMTMPPLTEDPEMSRPWFRKLRELRDTLEAEQIPKVSLAELSMGMSGDFEVAVSEGATLVRVGSAIFGERS